MNNNVKKACNSSWACRRCFSVLWGRKPKVLFWLYVSIIRPSTTWRPGCETASAKKRLSRIQRLACAGVTRAMRTTPAGAMEALTCLLPLDLVVQDEARSAAHRFWSLGCWSYLHHNRGRSVLKSRITYLV